MRIGIDIDNTITDIEEQLNEAAYNYAKQLGKEITEADRDKKIEDKKNDGNIYKKRYNFSYEELKYFLGNVQEEITNNAVPRPGAIEVIKKLKEEGHEIYIITARDNEFHKDPYMLSKVWLDKNNIEYDKLIVNVRQKGPVCKNEKIDVFIDDQLNNCLEVSKEGIKTIRFTADTTEYENIVNINRWVEVYYYIEVINKIKFFDNATQIQQDFRGHSRALRYICKKNNQKYFIKIYNNNRLEDLLNIENVYKKTKIPTARIIEKGYLEEINKTYVVYEYIQGKTLKELTKELEIHEIEKIGNRVGNYLARFKAIKGNKEDIKNKYELELKKLIENLYFMKNQYEEKQNKRLAHIDLDRLCRNFLECKEYIYKLESSFIHGDINLSNVIVKNGETYFIDIDGGKFSFRTLDFRGNCWYGWDGDNKEKEQAMYRGIYKGLFDGNIPDEFNKELAFTVIYEFLLKVNEPNKTGNLEKLESSFNKFYDIFVRTNYFENYRFEWFN